MVARVTLLRFVRLAALPHGRRVLVRLAGADVRRFLQGILTTDVEAVAPGQARPAAILTVKGKIVAEVIVLGRADGSLDLAIPAEVADEAIALLDRHIIMDDVTLTRDDAAEFVVSWPEPAVGPAVESFQTSYPAPGHVTVGPAEAVAAALAAGQEAEPGAWERRRIEAGVPAWGREITPGVFPPEVGFAAAVSYDKGCFMGQEPLARIHARGQVNRVMVRVSAGTCPQEQVDLAAPERPQAGRLTSWASVEEGGAIGLAIVHRSAAVPETRLTAAGIGEVVVTSGPLGDDPGSAGRRA